MSPTPEVPVESTLQFVVEAADTAAAVGSGDLDVLGTPRLLAWAEAATCAAIANELGEQQTSVGTRVTLEHRVASPVGDRVSVTARVAHRDGRLLRFEVTAVGPDSAVLAHGEVTRIVVDRARFLARLPTR